MLGAAVGAGEEGVLAVEGDSADRALDDVAVDLDAAVVEEAGESFPARERVADRLGELGLLADQAELLAQPRLEFGEIGRLWSRRTARRSAAGRPRISASIR